MTRTFLAAALALLASCTPVGFAPDYIVIELAPKGSLRAAIDYANPVLAHKDPKTGEPRGVAVELAHELAWRLKVPLEIVPYDAAKVAADARSNKWDVAFLAVDPALAADLAFTSPYVVAGGEQAMATPKDRERGAKYLQRFVVEQKENGFVAAALARSGQKEARVAP